MMISFHGDRVISQKTMAANKNKHKNYLRRYEPIKTIVASLRHVVYMVIAFGHVKIIGFMS